MSVSAGLGDFYVWHTILRSFAPWSTEARMFLAPCATSGLLSEDMLSWFVVHSEV